MKQKIYLIRHGETEWSLSDQHTGLTDIPLTQQGKIQAAELKQRLKNHPFTLVLSSPLKRATTTCQLAGFLDKAEIDTDLVECNYGDYEGRTTADILKENPSWNLFTDGAPNGESLLEMEARAKRVLKKIKGAKGDVILFSHGHFLRVLAACFLGLSGSEGKLFLLSTGAISILGYERDAPAVVLWNSQSS